MTTTTRRSLTGKWRIVEMDLWDTNFVDLVEPTYIAFDENGLGQFVFGAVTGGLDCRDTPSGVDFTWQGHDEMDEASGSGWARLDPEGTLSGEIRCHLGDESGFKARPW